MISAINVSTSENISFFQKYYYISQIYRPSSSMVCYGQCMCLDVVYLMGNDNTNHKHIQTATLISSACRDKIHIGHTTHHPPPSLPLNIKIWHVGSQLAPLVSQFPFRDYLVVLFNSIEKSYSPTDFGLEIGKQNYRYRITNYRYCKKT